MIFIRFEAQVALNLVIVINCVMNGDVVDGWYKFLDFTKKTQNCLFYATYGCIHTIVLLFTSVTAKKD